MKKYVLSLAFLLSGCVHQSVIPLGNNMAQIDVSAPPIYKRAGASHIAFETAAKATLDFGYDKFIVVGNGAWNEQTAVSTGYVNQNSSGINGSTAGGIFRHPESTMIIRMFHNGEAGSEAAIDARGVAE